MPSYKGETPWRPAKKGLVPVNISLSHALRDSLWELATEGEREDALRQATNNEHVKRTRIHEMARAYVQKPVLARLLLAGRAIPKPSMEVYEEESKNRLRGASVTGTTMTRKQYETHVKNRGGMTSSEYAVQLVHLAMQELVTGRV